MPDVDPTHLVATAGSLRSLCGVREPRPVVLVDYAADHVNGHAIKVCAACQAELDERVPPAPPPLFRLEHQARLEAARKWVGATVEVVVGRHPEPGSWHTYSGVTVVAVAVPFVGTVSPMLIIRRTDGREWVTGKTGRQPELATDTGGLSLADVRTIRPSFT